MALTISDAANMLIRNLSDHKILITEKQTAEFQEKGYSLLCGFNCRIANILGAHSFRVLVNLDWFRGSQSVIPKPSLTRGWPRPSFEFQLFPMRSKLLTLYYKDLYSYCHELEKDRTIWFNKPYWGMVIDPNREDFSWTGGNVRRFPLLRINHPNDLTLRVDQCK